MPIIASLICSQRTAFGKGYGIGRPGENKPFRQLHVARATGSPTNVCHLRLNAFGSPNGDPLCHEATFVPVVSGYETEAAVASSLEAAAGEIVSPPFT